jgi:broad specificity phosphatase PhoE
MKHILILVFASFSFFYSCSQKEDSKDITTYYLIRHAEKDRSDSTNNNPKLKETGRIRAENWSNILKHIPFDAVYSTNYNRTKETAQPTSTKNGLELTIYNADKINVESFLTDTKGKTVLIVGHSNTIPQFVNSIIGSNKYKDIEDRNNGNLYIVTIIDGKKSDQLLTIN